MASVCLLLAIAGGQVRAETVPAKPSPESQASAIAPQPAPQQSVPPQSSRLQLTTEQIEDLLLRQQLGLPAEDGQPPLHVLQAAAQKVTTPNSTAKPISQPAASSPAPADFLTRRLQAQLLLAEGQPQAALAAALHLNRQAPDDLDTYALLVQAHRQLGQRAEAVRQAQWLLNLRPTDTRGLLAAAELRLDHQDPTGALDLFAEAFGRLHRHQSLARAAVLLRMAEVHRTQQPALARKLATEALRLAPKATRIETLLESLP